MNTIPFVPGASFTHQNPLIVPVLSTKGCKGKSTQSANLADFLADAGKKRSLTMATIPSLLPAVITPIFEAPNGLYELVMWPVDLNQPEHVINCRRAAGGRICWMAVLRMLLQAAGFGRLGQPQQPSAPAYSGQLPAVVTCLRWKTISRSVDGVTAQRNHLFGCVSPQPLQQRDGT
jgi:hypothetical protein